MEKWIQPPTCLDHGLHVLKPQSFPPNHAPKMRERHQLFFGLQLVSKQFQHPAIQTKIEQHFGGFFHEIKMRQPLGTQDSMQPWSEQAGGWIHFCMKRLRTLKPIQIFKSEIKKSKTYSGWCPFQALYPMVPSHVDQIWLDGTFNIMQYFYMLKAHWYFSQCAYVVHLHKLVRFAYAHLACGTSMYRLHIYGGVAYMNDGLTQRDYA